MYVFVRKTHNLNVLKYFILQFLVKNLDFSLTYPVCCIECHSTRFMVMYRFKSQKKMKIRVFLVVFPRRFLESLIFTEIAKLHTYTTIL